MSTLKKSLAAVVLALAASGAANASTVEECLGLISSLKTMTDGVQTYTNDRDRLGLDGKADMARDKLNRVKFADSIQKLTDYYNQVWSLQTAAKPKIGFDDGETLKAGAQGAIGCIQQIGN